MKKISVAVTQFAVPAPRRGSIDANSGLGRAQELGVEIHQKIQAERKEFSSSYKPEVSLSHSFESGGFLFEVRGKADGIFFDDTVRIEEIKSAFNIYELMKQLRESDDHPYCLQVRTYGYFHWLKTREIPELSLHLVSTRNGEAIDFKVELNILDYENWIQRRLEELVQEAKRAEKRALRRRKAAEALQFPFEKPRTGQVELIQTIEDGMRESKPMFLQAPTGLGKTIGVLYPSLKEALSRGQRVLYVTPKNSQHAVAEDAVERLQQKGSKIKSLTLTAKSKICFKNEAICNPDYCEFAKDHYTKVAAGNLVEQLAKKKSLTSKVFKKMAAEHQVCPFELQLDASAEADTVICDYNHVFAPRSRLGCLQSIELDQAGKPNLVIDEAHNLPARGMDQYSPSLSVSVLEKIRRDAEFLPKKFRRQTEELIDNCVATIKKCAPATAAPMKISPPVDIFLEQDAELRQFLSNYLNSDTEIQAQDPVLQLSFYWSEFTSVLEYISSGRKEFFTTFYPDPAQIKVTCCDASEILKEHYKDFSQVVGFSATLKPFDFYSRLSGLESADLQTAEFVSPFSKSQRKLLIIPQVSSKYSERERNYPRIADAIARISSVKTGNYFVFFPSFDFLNRVLNIFKAPPGFEVLRQNSKMSRDHVDEILEKLKSPNQAHIVFAVQGGIFSEGIDYPGNMVIGAFVVGPALPTFDLVREEMRNYYETHYAAGFDYAYTYPAMAKAVQSAGRVIRTETDRGLIVLLDDRFTHPSYAKSMPRDWFEDSPMELVSQNILKDVRNFWELTADNEPLSLKDE